MIDFGFTLPGDLPENWVENEIVAPYGSDAALAKQYGYNYLMEMVNRAHRAINILARGGVGGFVMMEESIPAADRSAGVLYGLILHDWRGG